MFGVGVGTLRVNLFQRYVLYREIFRLQGDQGNKWKMATISLTGMKNDDILFKVSISCFAE